MRHDPIELVLATARVTRRGARWSGRLAAPTQSGRQFDPAPIAPDAIDEAFATLPRTLTPASRVDPPTNRADRRSCPRSRQVAASGRTAVQLTPAEPPPADKRPVAQRAVLADLAPRVAALDRQCAELARLLHGLETAAIAD